MPDPALPEPRNAAVLPGRVPFERQYRDVLGRAMRGSVDIISREPTEVGSTIVPASTARVEVADGVLRAQLLPGRYLLKAQLTTADGGTFLDDRTVTVTEP